MEWLLARARALEPSRIGVVACLGITVAAGGVLGQLGAVLGGLHAPGASSYTISDLTDTGLRLPSVDRAADVIRTWQGVPIPDGSRGPTWSVWSFALVDFILFAPAYALLLAIVLIKLRGSLEAAGAQARLDEIAVRRLTKRGQEPDGATLASERATIDGVRRADMRLADFALGLVPVLFLLDEAENILIPAVYHAGPAGDLFAVLFYPLWAAALVKWALGILIVVGLLVVALAAASLSPGRVRRLATALVVLRPQVLLLALFAAGLFASDQSADVILRWKEDWVDGAAAFILTACFAAVAVISARFLLAELPKPELKVPSGDVALVAFVLVAVGAVGAAEWQFGLGLVVLGVIIFAVLALSALAGKLKPQRRTRVVGRFGEVLPALLGGIPLVLLGLAALRTSVPEIVYSGRDGFLLLAGVGLVLQAIGWGVALRWKSRFNLTSLRKLLVVALIGVLVLTYRMYRNPWRLSEALGSIGVFTGFLIGATLFGFLLVFLSERYEAPSVFAVLRLKRTPVFLLLVLWAILAAKLDQSGTYYDVRTAQVSEAAELLQRQDITLDPERDDPGRGAAFEEWAAARPPDRRAVPLVFVAGAGGGIRAGYWVATVLDCVLEGRGDEPACQRHGDPATKRAAGSVFATSGISGGSVGLAAYATHLRHEPDDEGWREKRLGDDYIAPVIGWGLFVDLPLALIRRGGGDDRAAILERAFERSWVDKIEDRGASGVIWQAGPGTDESPFAAGIFRLWARRYAEPPLPLLLLNGTKVQDGCRVNSSVFDASVEYPSRGGARRRTILLPDICLALRPFERTAQRELPGSLYVDPAQRAEWTFASTEDLSDFVCRDRDVRLSTAAVLSSRFPFVLPSGRLERCQAPGAPAINVVDGGYFDTSAASPLVELWTELEPEIDRLNARPNQPCIVPFFLQIDTGYSDPKGATQKRPIETTVPLQTVKSARNAREANARQAAALAFSGPFGRVVEAKLANGASVDRFAHIYPRSHPGSKAPLGWTLSETARRDLDRQLSVNTAEITKVRDWFSASLRCDG